MAEVDVRREQLRAALAAEVALPHSDRPSRAPDGDLNWLISVVASSDWASRIATSALGGAVMEAWDADAPLTRLVIEVAAELADGVADCAAPLDPSASGAAL